MAGGVLRESPGGVEAADEDLDFVVLIGSDGNVAKDANGKTLRVKTRRPEAA
ncbi:hypothetical protein [Streptomyces sp. NPDC001966]